MPSTDYYEADKGSLRQQAEEILRARPPSSQAGDAPDEVKALIHELEVHQIELEMQNEELRSARSALETARDRYADLYDFSPVGRATLNNQGTILDANLTLTALLGVERARLSGEVFSRFVAAESQDKYHLLMQRLRQECDADAATVTIQTAVGASVQVLLQAIAVSEDAAAVIRVALTDITQRVAAEAALRESEQRFKSLVQSSPTGIHMYDLRSDGELIFSGANPAADRILGVDNSSFIGLPIQEAFPALADTDVPDHYRRAAEHGEAWEAERIDYEDERIVGAFKVYAFQTQPGRMVALFLDVTNERVIHQENQSLMAQLHHAQRLESIGTLASGVAHEVNNPLTGMINYAELIKDRVEGDARAFEYASEIIVEGNRIARIVRNLLSYSRPDESEPEECVISDVIERSLSLLRSSLLRDGITIHIDLETGLSRAQCKSQQIQQVLVNLITNSQHALCERYSGFDENKQLIISAHNAERDGMEVVRIAVEDHGAGIPASELEHIFDPFSTSKSRAEGTGLGLWVSHKLVLENGGYIDCVSVEGESTRLVVDLPALTDIR